MNYFLHSNSLWWYMVEESKYHIQVSRFINNLLTDTDRIFINDFVMIETFHLIIKQRGPKIGQKYVELLLNTNLIVCLSPISNKTYFQKIWENLQDYGSTTSIGGRDSSIIVTMKEYGLSQIITHDSAFDKVDGITQINPITS